MKSKITSLLLSCLILCPLAHAESAYSINNNPLITNDADNVNQRAHLAQEQLMNDPQAMMELQQLVQDPEIAQLLADPELVRIATSNDASAIANNPQAQALLNNPKMHALLEKLRGTTTQP